MSEDSKDTIFKNLFPTPLFVARVPNYEGLNKSLESEIKSIRDATPNGRPKSWSCDVYTTISNNFLLHEQAGFHNLAERFLEAATQFSTRMSYPLDSNELSIDGCWLNIYGRDHWQERHNHSANPIVAIYYVAAPPNCSSLILHSELADTMIRPRYLGNDQVDHLTVRIDPEPGMLVVFSGYLRHSVTASVVDGERISIAANFNFKPKSELSTGS